MKQSSERDMLPCFFQIIHHTFREERGYGEGGGVYVTLMKSDTVQSYGHGKADTRPGGLGYV